jgi:uncharacterized membrane protein
MKQAIEFFKTTILGGALIIVPAALIIVILGKAARALKGGLAPLADKLPPSIQFPYMTEIVTIIFVCFLAGLVIRTRPGRWLGGLIERHLYERVPGYVLAKSLTGRSATGAMAESLTPALVIVERHADGYVTVFVPSPPVPTVGQVYIFEAAKVHPVEVPLTKFVSCITKWGLGAQEMRLAIRK